MPKYTLLGAIVREVNETIEVVIEAEDPVEAQDIAYELLSEYPHSDFVADRLRVISRNGSRPTGIAIEFKTVQEEVFDDDQDD